MIDPRAAPLPVSLSASVLPPVIGRCVELVPEGLFVSAPGPFPPLFCRMRVRVGLPGGDVECDGEVVRIITVAEPTSVQLPVGCAVQLVDAPPALKAHFARAQQQPSTGPGEPDAETRQLLQFGRRRWDDHYRLLSIERDADQPTVQRRIAGCTEKLEQLIAEGPSYARLATEALIRVKEAGLRLGDVAGRAAYDAALGNFLGVARCIAAGLTPAQMDAERKKFLAARPMAAMQATSRVTTARLVQSTGRLSEALEHYEGALRIDPLNLRLHLAWVHAQRARPSAPCPACAG